MFVRSSTTTVQQIRASPCVFKFITTQAANQRVDNADSVEWREAKPFSEIPGPTKYGLVRGFLPGGVYHKKSFTDYLLKAREQYGDIYLIPGMFGKDGMLMTFNVDDFQRVFRTEGIWPTRPGAESIMHYRKKYRAELYDKAEGLINSHGERWASFRTAVNPILMQPRSAKTYVMPMQRVNSEFLLRIREIRDQVTHEVPGDFFQDIKRLAFESIAVVALNKELGLIRKNRDRPEANELFDNLQTFIDLMYNLEFQPSVWKYVWTPTYAKFKKCQDVVFETINAYVEEAVKQYEDEKRGNLDDSELSVLEKLMKIDKAVAVVMAVDMLMAGVDTTSVTLTGMLLQIAKNPEKQAKLREEIRKVLPEKDSLFTVESMQNLPYLRACIKESIRMHPIGPGSMRRCGENLVLCGYQVPKGTMVITNSNLLMSEEKYFPRAREFVPERWVRGDSVENTIVPFTYLPFGHGPRMCVGKRIVDIELEVTLARLVRNFYIEFNYPIDKAFKSHAMIRPDIPLTFKFSEVEN